MIFRRKDLDLRSRANLQEEGGAQHDKGQHHLAPLHEALLERIHNDMETVRCTHLPKDGVWKNIQLFLPPLLPLLRLLLPSILACLLSPRSEASLV